MEELDLLKKAWKKEEQSFEQVSEMEIYAMLHRKSSSIVKWILIISLIEFIFWNIFTLMFSDDQYQAKLHYYGMEEIMFIVNMINYLIILAFLYIFYKNYRGISTTDSTQQLMRNILQTRKTVQNYIWYNLGIATISIVLSILMLFYNNPKIVSLLKQADSEGQRLFFISACLGISIIFILLIIGIFWLFYKVLYGILLKKLLGNYKELKKIEL